MSTDFPKLFFIEKKYNTDLSNWWFPNESCLLAMLRSSGFQRIIQIDHDVFMCDPPEVPLFEGLGYRYALGEELWRMEKSGNHNSLGVAPP